MRRTKIKDSMMGPASFSDSEEHIEKAWEANTPSQEVKYARKALDADLDCIDGYILLAHNAASLGENLALLREATIIGERLWKPYFADKEMVWWGYIGTRPYMRALHEFGLASMEAGDVPEAEAAYRKLLKLNPNDNQGIRELLAHVLLLGERYDEAWKLCQRYKRDGLLATIATRLAIHIARNDEAKARETARQLDLANPHIMRALALFLRENIRPHDSRDSYVAYRSREEAVGYVAHCWDYWSKPEVSAAFLALFDGQDNIPKRRPKPKPRGRPAK